MTKIKNVECETHVTYFSPIITSKLEIEAVLEDRPVSSNWHPLIETPVKDSTDPTDVNEDSSRKKRKSGNDEDKDDIDNENLKAVKLQRKHFYRYCLYFFNFLLF